MRHRRLMGSLAALGAGIALAVPGVVTAHDGAAGFVYTETNGASGNAVLAFARAGDGSLTAIGSFATGGLGSGGGLGSQGAITLAGDGQWLLAVNAGSNDVSLFRVRDGGGLILADRAAAGGTLPTSVTASGGLAYVLDAGGSGNIAGFRLDDGSLHPLARSIRPLSGSATNPAAPSCAVTTPGTASAMPAPSAARLPINRRCLMRRPPCRSALAPSHAEGWGRGVTPRCQADDESMTGRRRGPTRTRAAVYASAMTPMETRKPARRCSEGISVPWPTGASPGKQRTHSSSKVSNSPGSRRDQLAHTTLSSELPASSSFAFRLLRTWRVCSRISPRTTWPVSGSIGPIDEM